MFPEEFDQALAVKDQGHVVEGWAVVNVDNLVYNNNFRSMMLCYPPDGSTSPKYKLLLFKPP